MNVRGNRLLLHGLQTLDFIATTCVLRRGFASRSVIKRVSRELSQGVNTADTKHNTSGTVTRFFPGQRRIPGVLLRFGALRSTSALTRMPLTRRRFKKRKRTKGSHTAYHLASQAMTRVRKLERKAEVKVFDVNLNNTATVGAGVVINTMAEVVQGDAINQRDGLQISPFFLKVNFQWRGVAASVFDVYRVLIFRDKRQVASSTPALLDVLNEDAPLSRLANANRRRWKILYDEIFTSHNDANIVLSFVRVLKIKLTLKMLFSGAGGGTRTTNGLFMIIVTNRLTTDRPLFRFDSRIFYNDG